MNALETEKKPIRDETGQFQAGTAPGPGRPIGSFSLTKIIKERLQELTPDKKRLVIERLADSIVQDAICGRNGMDKLIWAYLDGKPKESAETMPLLPPTPIMSCKHLNCLDCSPQARANFLNQAGGGEE